MAVKKLNVDLDSVVEAMEMQSDESASYLDTQSGEIIYLSEGLHESDFDDDDEDVGDDPVLPAWQKEERALARAIFNDSSERYIDIPVLESHEAYRVMEDFIQQVPDRRMREKLTRSIAGKGAFRRFKDTLGDDEIVRKQWFAFETEAKRQWAVEWLESMEIETTWLPAQQPDSPVMWQPRILGLHHVQITIPPREETAARKFYAGVLGLAEIEKPRELAGRGGFWLSLGDVQIHVGTEDGVERGKSKSHLAFAVTDLPKWEERLKKSGIDTLQVPAVAGFQRFQFRDTWGNLIEMIQEL